MSVKEIFDSIICLCAEGREHWSRKYLIDAIEKEALRGLEEGETAYDDSSYLDDSVY